MTGQFFVIFATANFHENPSGFSHVVTFMQRGEQSDFMLRLGSGKVRLVNAHLVKIPTASALQRPACILCCKQ
jgi:hypothetical protein